MRAPHILLVNVFFAPRTYGGATVVAEEVARCLVRDHGARVTVVSTMSRPDLAPYAVLRTEVRGLDHRMINVPDTPSYVRAYANPEVAGRVAEIARKVAPDVAHLHCLQTMGADIIPALKGHGVPVVLTLHDFWWLCERQFMVRPDGRYCGQDPVRPASCRGCVDDPGRATNRAGALRVLAGQADLVTCPGTFARGLHGRSGFATSRLVVWENGVRPPGESFSGLQAARRARDSRHVFGFVGGPSAIKGWPLLVDAFSGMKRAGFRGVLVDGSLDGSWYSGRDLSGLAGDWSVHPRYDQEGLDRFFAEIDTLLFLSQWKETYGLTIREALARGVRVIQTDAGGTMEHGTTEGVQVLPIGCHPALLQSAVERALDGPRGMAPVAVRTYAEQAAEFLRLVRPLLASAPRLEGVA